MSLVKKIFADKDGNIVVGQKPNLPILVWASAKLLTFFPIMITLTGFLNMLAFGALFTWAWLEIFDGSCLFRKILGAVVMVLLFTFNL